MDLLKEIGAILGFVAFGGLAVLTFLTFQQARHLRRLRDWAGRQPERAEAEVERLAELTGVQAPGPDGPEPDEKGPSRFDRVRGGWTVRMEELDRRSPVEPRILFGGLLAVLIGVGIATSGFGLFGGDSSSGDESATTTAEQSGPEVQVAVLNGTATEVGGVGVSGVADKAKDFVKEAGFDVGATEDAPGPFTVSVVMFEEGSKADAQELADALEDTLGPTEIEVITPEVQELTKDSQLALVVGQDDQAI